MKTSSLRPVTTDTPIWVGIKEASEIMERSQWWVHQNVTNGILKGMIGYYHHKGIKKFYKYCKQDLEAAKNFVDAQEPLKQQSGCVA